MKLLRTVSTGRLLAMMVGLVVAVGAGSAIAVAAAGNGPVPAPKPLATAVHDALAAPRVTGISAHIRFTNNLVGASALQGSADPILSGATGRVWLSNDRLRLELQSANGDAQVVVDNGSFWVYDPSSHTVYEGKLPEQLSSAKSPGSAHQAIPSIAQIQSEITRLMGSVNLSGAAPSDVAGQAAYTVRIAPKHDGGLLGSAQVAWDAVRGVPLDIAIYARDNSTPVLELKATDISYGPLPASDFNVSAPAGSKIVKISTAAPARQISSPHGRAHQAKTTGVAAVAAKLPFTLTAPGSLVGLARHTVTLLSWGGKPAALVTYGQNLGAIAVIEQTQPATTAKRSSQSRPGGLSLPTVSINGATGYELDTALGTVVRFTRAGVAYTIIGSVPAAAADLAARTL